MKWVSTLSIWEGAEQCVFCMVVAGSSSSGFDECGKGFGFKVGVVDISTED